MSDLIKTAFYQNHLDLGAKMVPYSGFEMPVSYSGLKEEHFQTALGVEFRKNKIDFMREAGLEQCKFRNLSGGIVAIHSAWRI